MSDDESFVVVDYSPVAQCPAPRVGGRVGQRGQIHSHHL